MNKEQFRLRLLSSIQKNGIADNLKSQLRSSLLLDLTKPNTQRESTMHTILVDTLIANYLKLTSLSFTLSVFIPEANIGNKMLSDADILNILHLENKITLTTGQPLLVNILSNISHKQTENVSSQTETNPEDLLEWKIRQLDKEEDQKQLNKHRASALAIEERMTRYQLDVDNRMKNELEEQLAKFKEIELAQMRVEERKKYNSDIQKARLDYEKQISDLKEKSTFQDEIEHKRLQKREKEMEEQNTDLRAKLLEESKRVMMLEMASKTESELLAKEMVMERDSLQKKYDQAMQQIAELNTLKDTFTERMNEKLTQYKIDINNEHAKMLSDVAVDRGKLENEKVMLAEKERMAENLLAQAKTLNESVEGVNNELKAAKLEYESKEKELFQAKETIHELEAKVNIQQSNTALEFELASLKRQLQEAELSAKVRNEEYQEVLKTYINNDEIAKLRKSESKWKRECQSLVQRLDFEYQRYEDLQKRYDEVVLQVKELRRDLSNARLGRGYLPDPLELLGRAPSRGYFTTPPIPPGYDEYLSKREELLDNLEVVNRRDYTPLRSNEYGATYQPLESLKRESSPARRYDERYSPDRDLHAARPIDDYRSNNINSYHTRPPPIANSAKQEFLGRPDEGVVYPPSKTDYDIQASVEEQENLIPSSSNNNNTRLQDVYEQQRIKEPPTAHDLPARPAVHQQYNPEHTIDEFLVDGNKDQSYKQDEQDLDIQIQQSNNQLNQNSNIDQFNQHGSGEGSKIPKVPLNDERDEEEARQEQATEFERIMTEKRELALKERERLQYEREIREKRDQEQVQVSSKFQEIRNVEAKRTREEFQKITAVEDAIEEAANDPIMKKYMEIVEKRNAESRKNLDEVNNKLDGSLLSNGVDDGNNNNNNKNSSGSGSGSGNELKDKFDDLNFMAGDTEEEVSVPSGSVSDPEW